MQAGGMQLAPILCFRYLTGITQLHHATMIVISKTVVVQHKGCV